jgi:hypothetical protein
MNVKAAFDWKYKHSTKYRWKISLLTWIKKLLKVGRNAASDKVKNADSENKFAFE